MKTAIFGGRFDPPHLGHWWIALQTLEERPDIDRLLLVPARQHQWKPTVAKGEDRLAMLSFFKHPKIEVSDIELQREGISYSIDTIKAVKEKQRTEVLWIVGADILPEFDRWEKKQELIQEATFLVFPRDPHELPQTLPRGFELIANPNLLTANISSTAIRKRIQDKKAIHGFVLSEIEKYIHEKGLYQ